MDLTLSLEQTMLKESVGAFARDYLANFRHASLCAAEGFARSCWQAMVDLGLLGAALPEAIGGYGGSAVDAMVIHEAVGAGLIVEPLLSTVFAARLIGLAGTDAQRDAVLPAIFAGKQLAVVAHDESAAWGDPRYVESTATPTGNGWLLSGHKCMVLDAPSADHVIISARLAESGALALFLVDAARLHDRMMACRTIDGRRSADLFLDQLQVNPDERMTGASDPMTAILEAMDHAVIANCAEALGAMDAALVVTADYLNTRQQFGSPIGSFQALQHKLADMVIAVELARSILLFALSTLEGDDRDARARGVSAAKLRIDQSADIIRTHAVQLHGGIGVTEEHVISHYFRRLDMAARRFGRMEYHLSRIAGTDS